MDTNTHHRLRVSVDLSTVDLAALHEITTAFGMPRASLLREGARLVIEKRQTELRALAIGREMLALRTPDETAVSNPALGDPTKVAT